MKIAQLAFDIIVVIFSSNEPCPLAFGLLISLVFKLTSVGSSSHSVPKELDPMEGKKN